MKNIISNPFLFIILFLSLPNFLYPYYLNILYYLYIDDCSYHGRIPNLDYAFQAAT